MKFIRNAGRSIANFILIVIGKILIKLLKLRGKNAGNLPGLVLWNINKKCMRIFKIDCPIIAVTGTNGKTSVTNYLNCIFETTGKKILTNKNGNNLYTGICSLLLSECDMHGRVKADYLVLETDESHVPAVYSYLKLETLVVLNFFRDQLDRNGEVESLILKIRNFLKTYEGNLVLNADDPNVARLAQENPDNHNVKWFRVKRYAGATEKPYEVGEGKFCPFCHSRLIYEYYQYSHIGKFHCGECNFGNASDVTEATVKDNSIVISDVEYKTVDASIYHYYNMTAVYTAAKIYNFGDDVIRESIEHFKVNNGRLETFLIDGSSLIVNLAKNPVGANMTLRIMNEREGEKELFFVLNDNIADGCDVSWIWDINFSEFKNVSRVVTSGTRAYDIAIRIKYAGYDGDKIVVKPDLDEAVKCLFSTKNNKFAIANYTAVQPVRSALKKYQQHTEQGVQ